MTTAAPIPDLFQYAAELDRKHTELALSAPIRRIHEPFEIYCDRVSAHINERRETFSELQFALMMQGKVWC